ncbi:MAG: SDR family NAD(P)-dependent oxidoreductase [Halothiobacillus sp.]
MSQARTLVITGVGRRIGAHLAAHYLAQGDRVIGTYRESNETITRLEAQGLIAVPCDLTVPADVSHLVANISRYAQTVDALVHNASVWFDDAACETDAHKIHELYEVHVTAPIALTLQLQQAIPAVSTHGQAGRLVVFITDAQCLAGGSDHAHYFASKAAAESAARSLAQKLAPHTRVNTLAPGLILFYPHDDAAARSARLRHNLLPFEPGAQVIAQTLDYFLSCPALDATRITVDCGYTA